MRILHVIAAMPPESGAAVVVAQLAREQQRRGHEVAVVCTQDPQSACKTDDLLDGGCVFEVQAFRCSFPRVLYFSWGLLFGLGAWVARADLVHVHSQWTFPVWWAGVLALRKGKPLVMSPHGAHDPVRLKYSGWKKRLAGSLDRRLLRRAQIIHATSTAERMWIESYLGVGGIGAGPWAAPAPRIVEIPNGVCTEGVASIVASVESERRHGVRTDCAKRTKCVLYLGRLHPLKGLDLLIQAWARAKRPGWQLAVAGPDEHDIRAQLLRQAQSLGLKVAERAGLAVCSQRSICAPMDAEVVFESAAFGDAKWRRLADADIVVLPSKSENFGVIVAEALACGVPVVTTKAAPWPGLAAKRCGWWTDVDAEALAKALAEAVALSDDERADMGRRGSRWVEDCFQWKMVAERMEQAYRSLL